MKNVMYVFLMTTLFACQKKQEKTVTAEPTARVVIPAPCMKEIVTEKPVKVGETGIMLPVGSKLCISADQLEIRVELPAGYKFLSQERTLPIYGTYTCNCSAQGSACQVFYADGLGFGCLQSSCTGSCTGRFTYKGYTVDKVVSSVSELFDLPEVQQEIQKIESTGAWTEHRIFGIPFFIVSDEKKFLAAASCDCEGTAACKMRTFTLFGKKIYVCEGACNGCELTV